MPVLVTERNIPLVERAQLIGESVAGPAADEVDAAARFPSEAIAALRAERMLSAFVPRDYGGGGCTISDLSTICFTLGQHCSATAMIYAMHQIQVACIVRHAQQSPYFQQYLTEIVDTQALIASATSEIGVGGDVRSSICAIERSGATFSLIKKAPVISYGEHADDVLATARRASNAAPSDQVLVLLRRSDVALTRSSAWNALGFRGTCSSGFQLSGTGSISQILPESYAEISSCTMLPVSHIVWTSLWLGMATAAVSKARAFVRTEARKTPGVSPPSSMRLAQLVSGLQGMRASVHDATREYERAMSDPEALGAMSFAIRMNNLKLSCSASVVDIVGQAMLICGMAGYRIDSPYTLGRLLRDAYGATLMINNDRIYSANASMLLVTKDD